MRKTVLFEKHIELKAKMVPFGGYIMPIQYSSIIKEHNATRNGVSIFDTCHMGEFVIKGETAVNDLEKILTCSVSDIKTGRCRYGFICNENGGVIDDQILYRISENEFFMVVNASTERTDFEWISSHISERTKIENLTEKTAKIDIQGPQSAKLYQKLMSEPVDDMKYYNFKYNYYHGEKVLTSRTGYTGEIGFEVYCTPDCALELWDECLKNGAVAAGLGARDTLRLEMGFSLYGHELNQKTNAASSGAARAISEKPFIGSQIVLDESKNQLKLVGIKLDGRRSAREGDLIFDKNGSRTGYITSGSYCPSVQCACALGYIVDSQQLSSELIIKTERGDKLKGYIEALPFYKQATGRKDIKNFL